MMKTLRTLSPTIEEEEEFEVLNIATDKNEKENKLGLSCAKLMLRLTS